MGGAATNGNNGSHPADTAAPLLSVRGVDFAYGGLQVLFGVDLDVPAGEILGLLGTNGAGKSTLLRAVSGLGRVQAGEVMFDGEVITAEATEDRVRRGLVMLPGGKAVFPSLTVEENLTAGVYTFVFDRERAGARVASALELFPILGERMAQRADTLSGGEQQMLALAKAFLLEPRLLLIDELTLGLAPVAVEALLAAIEGFRATGMTIVLVEQSLNVAIALCDRAVFMERGQIRFSGSPAELLERGDLARAVFFDGGPS
jgi:ABC-type branched-subunit amino acid transport system ATPase component